MLLSNKFYFSDVTDLNSLEKQDWGKMSDDRTSIICAHLVFIHRIISAAPWSARLVVNSDY